MYRQPDRWQDAGTSELDRQGNVAWYDLTENWRVRPRPQQLLDELARIP